MNTIKMETEQQQAQENEYGNNQWVELGGYSTSQHTSPLHEYGGFGFVSPTIMPVEPTYNMSIPPPYTSHQQLQPLIMPQWPSMMTTQPGYSAPVVPTASASAPVSANPPSQPVSTTPTNAPTPRRTLTDSDRRRMCLYHEENPSVKQLEIGAMFGVERSTVSKVLRQKEKYLYPDDGSRSPLKPSKGKFPDIERALSNWARNHQRQGLPLNDSIIREKARFFATTVGSTESHQKVNSTSWLEKFKQKNNLLGAKSRKGSINADDSDSALNGESNTNSASHTPNGISPISPSGVTSPSPMSPSRSQDSSKNDSPDGFLDFSNGYRHTHSQSATSLASAFSDATAPSLSGGALSPTSPYFSSDPSVGPSPFTPTGHSRLPPLGSNFARPRSQTFPTLGVDPGSISAPGSSDQLTPKNFLQQSMASSVLETPLEDGSLNVNPMETMKRNNSVPDIKSTSMQPPPLPKSNTASPISSPGSPTQDDARKALELVMTFFQSQPNGLVDPQEYMTIGKLMEKLKLAQSPGGSLPGGLHRIEEHDSPRVSKKRSIHSL